MKVSIVTACYNSAATIGDTLRSVNDQDYADIEHIVVDGGSTDGTLDIIAREGSRVARLITGPDRGLYDAINKGIAASNGDVVAILHSDDVYYDSSVIGDYVTAFTSTGCDAVYADLVYVDARNTAKVVRRWKSGAYRHGAFLKGWMPPHPTFVVRRAVYEKYGYYDIGFRTAADYELMLRFIHKERVTLTYLPRCTVKMRTGGVSNRTIAARIRANLEDRRAWRKNGLRPGLFTLLMKPLRKIRQFAQR